MGHSVRRVASYIISASCNARRRLGKGVVHIVMASADHASRSPSVSLSVCHPIVQAPDPLPPLGHSLAAHLPCQVPSPTSRAVQSRFKLKWPG